MSPYDVTTRANLCRELCRLIVRLGVRHQDPRTGQTTERHDLPATWPPLPAWREIVNFARDLEGLNPLPTRGDFDARDPQDSGVATPSVMD